MADTLEQVLADAMRASLASSRSPLRRLMTDTLTGVGPTRREVRRIVDAILSGATDPRAYVLADVQADYQVAAAPWGGAAAVYFVRMEVPGMAVRRRPIKIGRTNALGGSAGARLAGLQTAAPYNLTLLASFPEALLAERVLHAHFAPRRLRGEWFRAGARLRRLVAEVRVVAAPTLRVFPDVVFADEEETADA